MTHLDLFSGIGGIALAARRAGFDTRLFCEIDPYCARVLGKHWPGVPLHDDIRTLTKEVLEGHGIGPVTLLTGGFPCQPFSTAGNRRGKEDDRHLWPEMLRVVRECRPAWVLGENVAGFVRMALDDVLADLEDEGYECRAFMVPAAGVGAPHFRDRVFVVARDSRSGGVRPHVADALRQPGRDVGKNTGDGPKQGNATDPGTGRLPGRRPPFWRAEPRVGRMADGVPGRVDRRLKGLGNAVVPQQIQPFLDAIASIERSITEKVAV